MARKKKKQVEDNLWGDSSIEQIARQDLDIVARNHSRARVFRILIWMGIPAFLMVAAFGISQFTANQNLDSGAEEVAAMSAPGRPEATITVEEWLGTDPSPLPGGEILGWEGADLIAWPVDATAPNQQDAESLSYYQHNFILFTSAVINEQGYETSPQRFYNSSVLVALSPTRGVQVLTDPSLTPVAPSVAGFTTLDIWPGTKSANLPVPAEEAVDKWAGAYVGSDPVALRLATGDPNTDSAYTPIGGVKNYEVTVTSSAYLLVPGSDNEVTTNMVATVQIALDRSGTAKYLSTLPAITMDVLITDADSGAPNIVAWGPAGSGHLLVPYQNAVIIERLTVSKELEDASQSR